MCTPLDDYFHCYVRPQVHPKLTAFCTQLTGITQETVDKGAQPTVCVECHRLVCRSAVCGCVARLAVVSAKTRPSGRQFSGVFSGWRRCGQRQTSENVCAGHV